ncbi:hypothetical protein PMAYCL1PPCAC_28547, partial [Pristionchus mayeri]
AQPVSFAVVEYVYAEEDLLELSDKQAVSQSDQLDIKKRLLSGDKAKSISADFENVSTQQIHNIAKN